MNTTDLKQKLTKSTEFLKSELAQIRTGRASPTLLESIQVDAYGSKMSIRELGSISVLDSQNLVIMPWDKSVGSAIVKAIREGGLGLNPVEDPDKIRVPIPALTEERRKEFAKMVSTQTEEAKNAMRSIRQDTMKDIEKEFTDKLIGEDEKFRQKEEVEKIVKSFVEQAEQLSEDKKQELMKI